ncbi:MAG: Rne/Rng family ribonuclease [Solitalea-like symbiont of Acarus siro]
MAKELLINVSHSEISIALSENKRLIELHKETIYKHYSVGDIYLGKVTKIIPNLNAAFIDIGYQKDAFLHYLDLGPNVNSLIKLTEDLRSKNIRYNLLDNFDILPPIDKNGKISQILRKGCILPVQIIKEPISLKGPRLSSNISIAGRYTVLNPFIDTISISRKITSQKEKLRLKNLIAKIKPKNFGIIIRTASENKDEKEIKDDIKDLILKWQEFTQKLSGTVQSRKIIGEIGIASSMIRDVLSPEFSAIHVNDKSIYTEVKSYLGSISVSDKILKFYKGNLDMFEKFGIDKQIKALFGRIINMRGGSYLIIEHTEALHVIDVNSGKRLSHSVNQEEHALAVNIEAAKEVARQLRLRDMGGIIVVDFIDMQQPANKKTLYQALNKAMKADRAKHSILPPSKFGLVQITRQRVRPVTIIKTVEKCPTCNGTGEVNPSSILEDEINKALQYIIKEQNESGITILLNQYLVPYFKGVLFSKQLLWSLKYKKWIKIAASNKVPLGKFMFLNKNKDKLHI